MSGRNTDTAKHLGLVNRCPKAIPGGCSLDPVQSKRRFLHGLPCRDMSRQALNQNGIRQAALPQPLCSEDMLHGSVKGMHHATVPVCDVQRALIEQRLAHRLRYRLATEARQVVLSGKSFRVRLESRVRLMMRLAPQPVQQLVERIYPLFSPDYVVPMVKRSRKDMITRNGK